jgi:molybdate transport system substrate-binding protein
MVKKLLFYLFLITFMFSGVSGLDAAEKRIFAFCGAASKPAMEEAAETFKKMTGIHVDLNFGGSGTMLSQMKMSRRGDLYIPGSPDYMIKAEREGMVDPKTVRIIAYLVPAIGVQPGNPKNIKTLSDLAKPGVRVGIGNPEAVCVGLYAMEILEKGRLLEEVQKNIVTHASSCSETASLVVMKKVDAVLGWDVFSRWNPGKIETVFLNPHEIPRIAYIPAAVSTYAKDKDSAKRFIDFLISSEGQKIFVKWGYMTTEEEARRFAPKAKIGGEYVLPAGYKPPVKR